jgi:hypothetical protein
MPTRRQAIALGALASLGLAASSLHVSKRTARDEEPTSADGPGSPTPRAGGRGDGNVVDVREFGARGDGRTDDSAAITAAIEAAAPGETVLLPETSDAYLLSYDGNDQEAAIDLRPEMGLDDVTVAGETSSEGAQTLQVDPGSYDTTTRNAVVRLDATRPVEGLVFDNLTIDGGRPESDPAAGEGGEDALAGVHLDSAGANGGHDVTFTDCVVRNCSANAFRFEESGVTCRYVTARGNGRHGFNPVADDTSVDPGFVGWSLKAVDNGGTGIDHRYGTARVTHLYTENNRSGNKWKHHVRRLEVHNHRSVNDRNDGWRSNHSGDGDSDTPDVQEVLFDRVYVDGSSGGGIRVSGTDTDVRCELRGVEVRSATVESSGAGVELLRDVEALAPGSGHVVVVGTEKGAGVAVHAGATVDIDTYEHADNDGGPLDTDGGEVHIRRNQGRDPGPNTFGTPERSDIGAFRRSYDVFRSRFE